MYEEEGHNAWLEQLDLIGTLAASRWFDESTLSVVFSFTDEAQRKIKVAPVKNEKKGLFLDYERKSL